MVANSAINNISLQTVDNLYRCERHNEVFHLVALCLLAMSCRSIYFYFFRHLGIERQTDCCPTIVNAFFLVVANLLYFKLIWILQYISNSLGCCSKSATLIGCTHTIIACAIVCKVDDGVGGIIDVFPFICCFVEFEDYIAESRCMFIPLKNIIIKHYVVIPYFTVLIIIGFSSRSSIYLHT